MENGKIGNKVFYLNPTKLAVMCAESMAEHMQNYEFVLNREYVEREGTTSLKREYARDIDPEGLAFVVGESFGQRHDLMRALREKGYRGPAVFCNGEGSIRLSEDKPLLELYDFIIASAIPSDLRIEERIRRFNEGNSDKEVIARQFGG